MSDPIKREDALQALIDSGVRGYEYIQLKDAINAIPSADRPQGEWVRYMGDIWTCSACGENLMCDDIECNNYCPNCGARMKGADDE